jgi:hypothetical protein
VIKRLLKMVDLTGPEQRVVIFALCALVTFVALKAWRDGVKHSHRDTPVPHADQPSPSPGIRP